MSKTEYIIPLTVGTLFAIYLFKPFQTTIYKNWQSPNTAVYNPALNESKGPITEKKINETENIQAQEQPPGQKNSQDMENSGGKNTLEGEISEHPFPKPNSLEFEEPKSKLLPSLTTIGVGLGTAALLYKQQNRRKYTMLGEVKFGDARFEN